MTHSQRKTLALQGSFFDFSQQYHDDLIALNALWISDTPNNFVSTTSYKQALNKLGQEADLVVFDLNKTLALNALGAISGCIRRGGVLIILLPVDADRYKDSVFYQRLLRVLSEHSIAIKKLIDYSIVSMTMISQSANTFKVMDVD